MCVLRSYVKDAGVGMPQNIADKIFHRFIMANNNTHKLYRETGLGLCICKSLVEKLGETIKYETKLNKRTGFFHHRKYT